MTTQVRLNRVLRVGVIGAGRVGAPLAAALRQAGHPIVAASGVSPASRHRIDELLPGVAVRPSHEVAVGADLVLVTVPDDDIEDVVSRVRPQPGQVIAHTSGAHGLDILDLVRPHGAHPLALHPAMTFTGTRVDLDRLAEGISFGVTAPPQLKAAATRLVADLGGSPEWIDEEHRPLYHAALVHGSNHLMTLVNEAMDRLRDAGVLHPERVLRPLLRASLENALDRGDAALTGPVARGDAGTIARHLAILARVAPDSVAAYLALARRTADRAIASGRLPAADAVPLLGVLATVRERVDGVAA